MGVFDKIRRGFGIDDEDEFEEEYDESVEEEDTPVENTYKADFSQNTQPTVTKREKPVVTAVASGRPQYVLVKPVSFGEAVDIADNINLKKTVVLNLEECEVDTARRLVDFLSGVAYANAANLYKIANSTFLITPENSDNSGLDLFEDKGSY